MIKTKEKTSSKTNVDSEEILTESDDGVESAVPETNEEEVSGTSVEGDEEEDELFAFEENWD